MADTKQIDDILAAYNIYRTGEDIRRALAEAGYEIVPKEPTEAMVDAAEGLKRHTYQEFPGGHGERAYDPSCEAYYRAMIEAASNG
jgi:hypothetical protein